MNLRDFRQPSILVSERSGLLTQIAANGKCFVVRADQKLTAFFWNKFGIPESESLLFGTNFGIGTDNQTRPNGNLFVVSMSNGAVYEIFRR